MLSSECNHRFRSRLQVMHILVYTVRNLDILMFDLIQKITHNIVVAYMCTCAILSLLRLEINIARTTATTADILKTKSNRLRLYPEEGPVPKAPAAPFTLVDIVCCMK